MDKVNRPKLSDILNKIDQEEAEMAKGNADVFDANPRLQATIKAARPTTADMVKLIETPPAARSEATITSPCDEDYVRVYWPPELASLRHEFRRFVEGMTFKLRKNADKRTPDEADLPQLFALLRGEIDELERAMQEGNSIETLLESSDAANFCMLIAAVAMKRGIK